MPTLGEVFREGRYRLNLSLDQAEAETKIRKKYLLALEDDDYATLPAPIYARGFIQIYAEYLEVDPGIVEKLYHPPDRIVSSYAIRPAATGFRDIRPISLRAVVTFLVVLIAIAGVVALYAQYLSFSSVGSPVVDVAAPRPTPLPTATRSAAAVPLPTAMPMATVVPSPTPRSGVEVALNVIDRTWVRVIVDGQSVPTFEGEIQAGEVRSWTARDRMDMRVGNAGGVEVTVNGMRQGKLGASGEVKNITWGRQ